MRDCDLAELSDHPDDEYRIAVQCRREAYYAARARNRKWWVRLAKWLLGLFR